MKIASLILLLIFMAIPELLAAEEERLALPEVLVTDSPILSSTEFSSSGDTIQRVGEEQIENLAANDLATALDRVPGVSMSRHNPIGAYGGGDGGGVFIRGHGSSRPGQELVTLIDGVPRFSGIWSHSLLDMLSIDAVEEIEVYKSPQGVRFGNMGFAAINIRPKTWRSQGSGGHFKTSFGRYDTTMNSAFFGSKRGRKSYTLSASHRASDGNRENSRGVVDAFYGRYEDDWEGPWRFGFQIHHSSSDVEDPRASGAPEIPLVENFETRGDLFIASFDRESVNASSQLKFYFDDGLQDWLQWDASMPEPFSSVTEYQNYGFRGSHRWYLGSDSEAKIGFDLDRYGGDFVEERDSGDRNRRDLSFETMAPYLMLESRHRWGAVNVIPSAGLRYNHSEEFGDDKASRVALSFERGAYGLQFSRSRSFSLPGVYASILFGGGPSGEDWRELEAEVIEHEEISLSRSFGEKAKLSLTYFDDEVDDALRAVFGGGPPQLLNLGSYESDGFEFALDLRPRDDLTLFLGGSFSDVSPEDVPYQAKRSFIFGVNFDPPSRWSYSFDLRYSDSFYAGNQRFPGPAEEIPSHGLVNLRLAKSFSAKPKGDDGEIFLAIENLNDRDYELKPGYPMPGRWLNFGVKIRF